MNEHQILYDFKKKIECEIQKNKLFSLPIEEAYFLLFEKAGVLYKLTLINQNKIQKIIKEYYDTKQERIDELSFFQESIKWIMRWCTQYCINTPQKQAEKIQVEDIFKLMGIAYAYDRFHLFWDLHNKGIMRYRKDKNHITFNYTNEEVFKQHVCYDSLLRETTEHEGLNNISGSIRTDYKELMKQVHHLDFNCNIKVEFSGFDLEDYKEFTTALTDLFTENFLSKKKNNTYILHVNNEVGLIYSKDDWVIKIVEKSTLDTKKVIDIINFFTYDNLLKSDVSLTYFIHLKNDLLLVPEVIFSLTRPEVNALRLLAKRQFKSYDKAQNNFEYEMISKITNNIFSNYLTSNKDEKSKNIRPGMDLLIYDENNNELQVVELKYKIPVESGRDILNLDKMLEEGYNQIGEAKEYVQANVLTILEEYYGEKYKGVKPKNVDYFIITNYSIGTGGKKEIPTPILNIDHYVELMKDSNGLDKVRSSLYSKNKKIVPPVTKKYCFFKLLGYRVTYPEYKFIMKTKLLKSHLDSLQ
ncbi:hypothetical protein D3P07_25185 [Paenibacillus sp. 1011MAR3C5]|uniref:hypothetical protein n=1 Tax=Paenibacillus sp. 1011MAR3C5 TaxID=1675787 RepID=UPI000E6C342A|nr:hypothetical protein [Paenibacillus sp. 1011MAR3C5]RJE83262.1 hypothetical protein D3P07_25185 [Paenibacillus sp. 1011MAR3C5]